MRLLAAATTALTVALTIAVAMGWLDRVRPRRRPAARRDRQEWLLQAGVDLTPRQFAVASAALAAATFATVGWLSGAPGVAVVPAVVAGLAPRALLGRRRALRLREVQQAWPDGLRDLLAAISAGLSLNQAVAALATDGPEPLQRAFARYPALARTIGVVPALEVVKQELADPTSDRVIEVLILAHERGGQVLSEILRDLAEATTRDVRTLEQIATESLEQRINARAVFALPWLVLVVLTLQGGHFRDFYRSAAGLVVIAIGGALSLLGTWLVSRLAREPVEQRVFAEPRGGEGR